jgi:hypothetical protein
MDAFMFESAKPFKISFQREKGKFFDFFASYSVRRWSNRARIGGKLRKVKDFMFRYDLKDHEKKCSKRKDRCFLPGKYLISVTPQASFKSVLVPLNAAVSAMDMDYTLRIDYSKPFAVPPRRPLRPRGPPPPPPPRKRSNSVEN